MENEKKKGLNTNSNSYTIIYSVIIVIIVAFLLAFVSKGLEKRQNENVALDAKKQILYALNIRDISDEEAKQRYTDVVLSDDIICDVVNAIVEQNQLDQESPAIVNLKAEIKEMERKIEKLLDQMESADGSEKLATRLRKREQDLDALNKQLIREQAKQRKIDPILAKQFLECMRDAKLEGAEYDRLLINTLVDKIFLYDDHFRLLFKKSEKAKASKRDAAEVESYFDNKSSATALDTPP